MFLSLPVIAADVPAVIDFGTAGARHLRLALAMSRLGMISDEDLAPLRKTRMGESALKKLIDSGWQRTISADYEFSLISAYARLILATTDDEEFIDADGEPVVVLAINAAAPTWIVIGKAIEAVEAAQPGLGRAALDILDATLCRFGFPLTPSGAFEIAQMLHWQGEDDEHATIEEYGGDADVPTRADLFEGVPDWAYDWKRDKWPVVPASEFASHATRLTTDNIGPLLAALAELQHLERDVPTAFAGFDAERYEDCSLFEPPIVTGWRSTEDFTRVFDDHFNWHSNGGEYAPWIGCIRFVPSEEGITNALPSIRHTGAVLRALDKALVAMRDLNNEL